MTSDRGEMTVAQAIAGRLVTLGVKHVFGYPGGETLDLLEAFRAAGIKFVLTHHETAAAFAAAATGELTGVPGVCMATLGPGATNLVSGVAAALLERAPLLAFTAQLPRARRETTTHQRLDLNDLFRPVTKASLRLEPADALRSLEKGIRIAMTGRPGPVHFEVASDVPRATCTDAIGAHFFGAHIAHQGLGAAPPATLKAAANQIAAARHPIALIGAGALTASQAVVTTFVEKAGLPVVTTPKAKGLVSERHPLFAGVIEMLGKQSIVDWLAAADCLVYIGFDPVELDMLWEHPAPGVLFDSVPDTDVYYRVDTAAIGAIELSLAGLTDAANPDGGDALRGGRAVGAGEAAALACRQSIQARVDGGRRATAGSLSPGAVVAAVRAAATAPDALATTDVGAHKMAAGQLWVAEKPGCFMMSNGQSSMGYGLPTAMAAKLLRPERQVVALVGDGGLAMYLAELATVARLGLSLPVVVFADRQLTLIAMGQERRGYPREGVGFASPDYPQLAASLGGYGAVVDSAAQLEAEVTNAWSRPTFSLLAVPVDDALYRV